MPHMQARALGRPKSDPARDLRRDLLLASRQMLDEGGPTALSMREVARRTGCTHQAPYHYFENREAILAALVAEGFDTLAVRLEEANDLRISAGVRAALLASGAAYLGFALGQPGVFRIMFRPDVCDPAHFPAVRASSTRARAALDRLCDIVHGPKANAVWATIIWAHVHGLACLVLDGPLTLQFQTESQRDEYLRAASAQFVDMVLAEAAR